MRSKVKGGGVRQEIYYRNGSLYMDTGHTCWLFAIIALPAGYTQQCDNMD
jgi:hypothetical protein